MCRVANDTLKSYGIFLIILGGLGILFGVICFGVCVTTIKYGAGPVWCGIFVVITGICAYKGGAVPTNESNRGWVGVFLAMDIITIILSFASWCLAIAAVADDNEQYYGCHQFGMRDGRYTCLDSTSYFSVWYKTAVPHSEHSASLGINSVSLIIAFIQFIVTFVFSIVGCCILCAGPDQRQTVIYQTTPAGQTVIVQHNPQMVQATPAQVIIMGPAQQPGRAAYPSQAYQVQPATYQVQPGVVYQPAQQQGAAYPPPHQPGQPHQQPQPQQQPQQMPAPVQPTAPPQYHNDPPPAYDAVPTHGEYK
ncbi:uncharacterized protein [Ptychodera flava]|uniref:uncharacterized protein n=1 Tax=Ptychodera flava TaxID=63121 RepID=UPI00396A6FE5